tara:strand:- start:96 stop:485 length:390 start_codon:yes stop_codon:yes gene_type:complete
MAVAALVMLALPLVATFVPAALPTRFVSPGRSAVCAARISPDLVMLTDLRPGEPGYKRARLKNLLRRAFQPGRVKAEEAEAAEAAAYTRRKEDKAAAKKLYDEELERDRVAAEKVTPRSQILALVLTCP